MGYNTFDYFDHWTSDNTGDWISGELDYNNYYWWENTRLFTTERIFESKSRLLSWYAGLWDQSIFGWTHNKVDTWGSGDHVIIKFSMKESMGATNDTVRVLSKIKKGTTTTTTNFVSVPKPDPEDDLSLWLFYSSDEVYYEWKNVNTETMLASGQITGASIIPYPDNVPYLFHEQLDVAGGIFSWLQPTTLNWGNHPANGGCEWDTDYWFIRNHCFPEPGWDSFGIEEYLLGKIVIMPEQDYIKVYPNPADEILNVSKDFAGAALISIININGTAVYDEKIVGEITTIDVSRLPSGIYFVKLQSEKVIAVKRVVIK